MGRLAGPYSRKYDAIWKSCTPFLSPSFQYHFRALHVYMNAAAPLYYPRHSGADGQPRPAGDWAHLANVGAFARTKRSFMYCDRSLPPFTNEKNTTSTPDLRRRMTPPHQRFSPRIFPQDASRAEREFVRAQRRPGLPRDQFSGPWLFSTAEARTINSSSPNGDLRGGTPAHLGGSLQSNYAACQSTRVERADQMIS